MAFVKRGAGKIQGVAGTNDASPSIETAQVSPVQETVQNTEIKVEVAKKCPVDCSDGEPA